MKILCFGDSNTYGWDPRSCLGGRYDEHTRWPGLLAAEAGLEVVECGENGRCIPHREYQLRNAARELTRHGKVDIIIIMLGGNDLLTEPDFCAEDVAERMEDFLLYLRTLPELVGTRLTLVAPPPMAPGEWTAEPRLLSESARLPGQYRELAGRVGADWLEAPEGPGVLDYDGVHLTARGHRELYEAVRKYAAE